MKVINIDCIINRWQYKLLETFRRWSHERIGNANYIATTRVTSQLLPKWSVIGQVLFKHMLRAKWRPVMRVNSWRQAKVGRRPREQLHTQKACMIMNNIKFAVFFNCVKGKLHMSTNDRK
ncbi:hypothetical protein D9M68_723990 [compost metagenome]